jgi:nucleotide sugar dehydrogenase
MNVGICGVGIVGSAICSFFSQAALQPSITVHLYDKFKPAINNLNVLLATDVLFICLPTPFDTSLQAYEMTEVTETLSRLNDAHYTGIILLKSTVEPLYCQFMNNLYPSLFIMHNPEFLTARQAKEDFQNQKHIVLGGTAQSAVKLPAIAEFYKTFFPRAVISQTDANSSSLMKMACNSFYATKIQFFNEIYHLSQALSVDYGHLQDLMTTQNDWIHPMHTQVPGPDGQFSFGGACLPKDCAALKAICHTYNVNNAMLATTLSEQQKTRQE